MIKLKCYCGAFIEIDTGSMSCKPEIQLADRWREQHSGCITKNPESSHLFVRSLACNARIEAMKAMNKYREKSGESPEYCEESFLEEANTLEAISREIERLNKRV